MPKPYWIEFLEKYGIQIATTEEIITTLENDEEE